MVSKDCCVLILRHQMLGKTCHTSLHSLFFVYETSRKSKSHSGTIPPHIRSVSLIGSWRSTDRRHWARTWSLGSKDVQRDGASVHGGWPVMVGILSMVPKLWVPMCWGPQFVVATRHIRKGEVLTWPRYGRKKIRKWECRIIEGNSSGAFNVFCCFMKWLPISSRDPSIPGESSNFFHRIALACEFPFDLTQNATRSTFFNVECLAKQVTRDFTMEKRCWKIFPSQAWRV